MKEVLVTEVFEVSEVLDADFTAGALRGIPIFCVNRVYTQSTDIFLDFVKNQWILKLKNGTTVSIIESRDTAYTGGCQYELLEIEKGYLSDVSRGDAMCMHLLLVELENRININSVDNP